MANKMQDRLAGQKQQSLARASALLPGEHVRYVIGVRTGLSPKIAGPHWGFDLTLLGLPFWHARVIVVTDKSIVICKAKGKIDASIPKEVLCRLPRDTRLGPVQPAGRMWGHIQAGDKRMWLALSVRQFIERADAELAIKSAS
jgi:hypothetical protein